MPRDEESSGPDESIPLANLADRVAHKHPDGHQQADHVWEKLEQIDHPDENDLWELLSTHASDETTQHDPGRIVISAPIVEDNRRKVGGLSPFGQVIHGYLTTVVLLTALLIVTSTLFGVIDTHYWVVSLPFFTLGIILLVPILAWELDFWDPREIG